MATAVYKDQIEIYPTITVSAVLPAAINTVEHSETTTMAKTMIAAQVITVIAVETATVDDVQYMQIILEVVAAAVVYSLKVQKIKLGIFIEAVEDEIRSKDGGKKKVQEEGKEERKKKE